MTGTSRWLLVALLIALLMSACAGAARQHSARGSFVNPPQPGVSTLSYAPKPYFKDMTAMKVRFTTTGTAGRGREYIVWLFTGKTHRDQRCYPEYSWERGVRGSPGKEYEVTIETVFEGRDEDALACFGRAQLVVWTQKRDFGHPLERRVMRKLSFWIHRPRTG